VPWQTAYLTNQLLPGEKRFVLGASGHIAGVINPPQKKKRNYWINPQIAKTPQDWFSKAQSVDGSWWPDCVAWLVKQSGKKVKSSPTLGNRQYQVIEPAPGRYVRE
jgi:polyhydroxyalkanoate synthase